MLNEQRLTDLAGAVADGQLVDWESAAETAITPEDRELLASLRGLAAIGGYFGNLTAGSPKRTRPILAPNTNWGPLRILEHVGRGSFGDVYRAWDPALAREVALKLIDGGDAPFDAHVVDEGRLMARVRHPNVVTIHGAQRINGTTGLWMEFIEGRTLESELAERGYFGADQLISTGLELCGALGAVHAAGLVHRDVKASNVLRDPNGRLLLGDFGTGGELDRDETRAGLVGTPAYLAPEIFARQPATPQSDLYSLGVLLFHLATGKYPFADRSLRALRDAHATGTAARLTALRPEIPSRVAAVITRALEPDPARRYATAEAMAAALDACRQPSGARRYLRRATMPAVTVVALAAAAWFYATSRPAVDFHDRDWALVARFENATGNAVLDGSLEYALALELANSTFVNVVPDERVQDALALMRRPPATHVDADMGTEIARRDGDIRVVLAGRAEAIGGGYRLTVRLIDPNDGSVAASVAEEAGADADLIAAIHRLAVKVRERLGETLPAFDGTGPQLPKVTTSSIAALNLYAQALPDLGVFADPGTAETLLRDALSLDADFSAAHVAVARAIRSQSGRRARGTPDREYRRSEILDHLDRATTLAAALGPADRYAITIEAEGLRAMLADRDAARAHLELAENAAHALRRLRPDNLRAVEDLIQISRQLERPPATTLELAHELVRLRPNNLVALHQAASRSVDADQFDAARDYLARGRPLLDLPVEGTNSRGSAFEIRTLLFNDAWRRNDIPEAVAIAAQMQTVRLQAPPLAASGFAEALTHVFITLGQLAHAAESAAEVTHRDRRALMLSVALRYEDPERFRLFVQREYPDLDRLAPNFAGSQAGMYMAIGRFDDARKAIELVRREGGGAPLAIQRAEQLESRLALVEGNPHRAVALIEPVVAVTSQPPGNAAWVESSVLLAQALVAAGRSDDAIGVLERVSAVPRELRRPTLPRAHHWMLARDLQSRLYREAGRIAEADTIDIELRMLLTVADSDHPIKRRLDGR